MKKQLIFAVFATAALLAMIREWSAPVVCRFPGLVDPVSHNSAKLN